MAGKTPASINIFQLDLKYILEGGGGKHRSYARQISTANEQAGSDYLSFSLQAVLTER